MPHTSDRREFLKQTSTGIVAAAALTSVSALAAKRPTTSLSWD